MNISSNEFICNQINTLVSWLLMVLERRLPMYIMLDF